jgi:hypothetical protein
MKDYENLLVTPPYQGARKYGKTSRELGYEEGERKGQQKLLRELLAQRFGALSEQAIKHLEDLTEEQLVELGKKLLTASSLRELGLEPSAEPPA